MVSDQGREEIPALLLCPWQIYVMINESASEDEDEELEMNDYDGFDATDEDVSYFPTTEQQWSDDPADHDGKCICPRCVAMEMDY